jgi:hypothetical protein
MMKYLTPMSFDVLSYAVLSHLADAKKTQLKEDGLHVSLWMQVCNHRATTASQLETTV